MKVSYQQHELMKGFAMKKRSIGFALLFILMGMTLGGCACGTKTAVVEETAPYTPPPVVRQETQRTYPVAQPVPPPKPDRN